jgi:hypothetical protein
MIWVQFAATALVIVLAGVRLLDTATFLAKRRGWVEAGSTISATGDPRGRMNGPVLEDSVVRVCVWKNQPRLVRRTRNGVWPVCRRRTFTK